MYICRPERGIAVLHSIPSAHPPCFSCLQWLLFVVIRYVYIYIRDFKIQSTKLFRMICDALYLPFLMGGSTDGWMPQSSALAVAPSVLRRREPREKKPAVAEMMVKLTKKKAKTNKKKKKNSVGELRSTTTSSASKRGPAKDSAPQRRRASTGQLPVPKTKPAQKQRVCG